MYMLTTILYVVQILTFEKYPQVFTKEVGMDFKQK